MENITQKRISFKKLHINIDHYSYIRVFAPEDYMQIEYIFPCNFSITD